MVIPIAVVLGSTLLGAALVARSPLGRALRLQWRLLASTRHQPEFDQLESYDEPVPLWLRPGGSV